MDKNDIVMPGTFLGYEEEFFPGKNTYEENGKVFASVVGKKKLDSAAHEAIVEGKKKTAAVVSRDSIVTGRVVLVKDKVVILNLMYAEKDGKEVALPSVSAALTIENMDNSFVKTASDLFRLGDVVKARVYKVTSYSIELDTKADEFGVVKAFGIRSRKPLHLIDGKLRDPITGATESRKISSGYYLR